MRTLIISILLLMAFTACNEEVKQPEAEQVPKVQAKNEQGHIRLSKAQVKMAKLEFGKLQKRQMHRYFTCNGRLEVLPQYRASVSAPLPAFVQSLHVEPMQFVRKGQVLATLKHQDFIRLQQDYLEAKAKLGFTEKEYQRQKTLAEKNATARKKFEASQAELEGLRAQVQSYQAQLEMIGISTQQVQQQIVRQIPLISPISGYLAKVNLTIGKYVPAEEILFEIIETQHMHLSLQVFERDIYALKVGQPIQFWLADAAGKHEYQAKITQIGQAIDPESKTLSVRCQLEENYSDLRPMMFVRASVETQSENYEVLPESALVGEAEEQAVFVQHKNGDFERVKIKVSAQNEGFVGFTEIPEALKKAKIVLKGAHYLETALQQAEEEG